MKKPVWLDKFFTEFMEFVFPQSLLISIGHWKG